MNSIQFLCKVLSGIILGSLAMLKILIYVTYLALYWSWVIIRLTLWIGFFVITFIQNVLSSLGFPILEERYINLSLRDSFNMLFNT